jgi:hypothetical protein
MSVKKNNFIPATDTITSILKESSKADELTSEFELSLPERYKRFLIDYVDNYKKNKPNRLKFILYGIELFLAALGAALGFFIIYSGNGDGIKLVIWIAYIILFVAIGLIIKLIPSDNNVFYLEATKIRLLNLSERLATEVALFSLLEQTTEEDDEKIIEQTSALVPNYNEFEQKYQKVIQLCQDTNKVFSDPRETNIVIKKLNVDEEIIQKLNGAIRQIVELCGHIFASRDFSAKLYLRVIKDTEKNQNIEMLIPFAKFPASTNADKGIFGNGWVKARGNPSLVWECLEKGQTIHSPSKKDFKTNTVYYNSLLAICLPGRIGVLALTSNTENAFKDKYDDWVIKSLSLSSRIIFLRLLSINE